MSEPSDTQLFIDALRECLGLRPLYRIALDAGEPPSYGVPFDEGNRHVTPGNSARAIGIVGGIGR